MGWVGCDMALRSGWHCIRRDCAVALEANTHTRILGGGRLSECAQGYSVTDTHEKREAFRSSIDVAFKVAAPSVPPHSRAHAHARSHTYPRRTRCTHHAHSRTLSHAHSHNAITHHLRSLPPPRHRHQRPGAASAQSGRIHIVREWAHPCHICSGPGLTPATSAQGLGWPRCHICPQTWRACVSGVLREVVLELARTARSAVCD